MQLPSVTAPRARPFMGVGAVIRASGMVINIPMMASAWDAAGLLAELTRCDLRALLPGPWGTPTPGIVDEFVKRSLTPPCITGRCKVHRDGDGVAIRGPDGKAHWGPSCNCKSGFQYASDEDGQAAEGCKERDVWSALDALRDAHYERLKLTADDAMRVDCDDLTSAVGAVYCYLAWQGYPKIGLKPDHGARYRVGITHPGDPTPEDAAAYAATHNGEQPPNFAHAYLLMNRPPPKPQQAIPMMVKVKGTLTQFFVFDVAAHFGMRRPPDDYYGRGTVVSMPIRREDLGD